MTATNVAMTPGIGRTPGRGAFAAVALSLGLVAGLGIGALAFRPATATGPMAAPAAITHTTHPRVGPMAPKATIAASATVLANYTQVVANLKAAESRHDFAAKARFERELTATLTAEAIGLVYQERTHLLESLADAKATGQGYAIWRIGEELKALFRAR